jgi:ornithine cyclodeaminase/alanine dehydrogenase-like protein (mu-crystallin family)
LYIYDLHKESAQNMAMGLKNEYPDVEYLIAKDANRLVEKSSVIIAATTSCEPLFEINPNLVLGKTFISIGSFRPDMQEFPNIVIAKADYVFVDTMFAIKESGDIANPIKDKVVKIEKIQEFASVLEQNTSFENKTIFFKSVGMALFDLTVASAIYQMAVKENIGQKLEF